MTPYFEQGGVTLYHGDCRDILPELTADLVVADPPYGETALEWDTRVDGWQELVTVDPGGSMWVFGSLRSLLGSIDDFDGWSFVQEIIWEKHNGSNFLVDRFRRVHEIITHWRPSYRTWSDVYKDPQFTHDAVRRQIRSKGRPAHMGRIERTPFVSDDGGPRHMRSVIPVRSCHGYAIHPTQKPIGILTPIISYSCPPGGTVLDPFAGSGSTQDAARLIGRRAIGIEIDERWCEAAARRLEQQVLPIGDIA